ncbi:MAG: PilZ domain-containing protein [Candidatus Devosia euplotis]|nr:PilZ domain-containing protein [Candidatus Devosia euplotis]
MSEERRATIRRRALKGGHIVTNGDYSTYDCTVRNLSEAGARLKVAGVIGTPEQFTLDMDGGHTFGCHMVWRTELEIGVKFA